jgi:hypothetical protein
MDKFFNSIDKQIEANQGKNLFADQPSIAFIQDTVLAIAGIKEIDDYSEKLLIDYATDKALSEFYRVNQYYSFDSKAKSELKQLYSNLFSEIRRAQIPIDAIAQNHYLNLKQWILKHNAFAEKVYSNKQKIVEPVACAEYSTNLQIKLLGIDAAHIMQPVLDVGCGGQGNLVKFLQQNKIETYGIDRYSFEASNFISSDWLEYDFGDQKWGTIVSHLGFSNHFIHHNLREDGNFIGYARKYMEILKSLKVGGRFCYTPGLPFIEKYLDQNQFKIVTTKIEEYNFESTKVKRMK